MPEVERIQSVNDQLRREVGIERTRVSVSAKQYVREQSIPVHPPTCHADVVVAIENKINMCS